MNVYEVKSMAERMDGNTYPGRGIVLGITPDGKQTVAQGADGMVDDQMGILHQRRIVGLGADAVGLDTEDAVTAVDGAAHDEVGSNCLRAVGGDAQHDAAAGIGIAVQALGHGLDLVNVHWNILQMLFL